MRAVLLALAVSTGCPAPPPKPPEKPPEKPVERPIAPARPERELPEITVAQARSRFSLDVLGLELVGTVDPAAAKVARQLTTALRTLANADPLITLGKRPTELIDARVLAGCNNDELPCMRQIAQAVGADRIVYGFVNDLKGEYYVHVTLLDAKSGATVKWTGTTLSTDDELEYTAKVSLSSLITRAP